MAVGLKNPWFHPVAYFLVDRLNSQMQAQIIKEGLQSVLRTGSAHNKGGPPNINIVQISHFSNSF